MDADNIAPDESRKARAVVVQADRDDGYALLEQALAGAGFWERIAAAARTGGVQPAELRVLITPDLSFFDQAAPTGTDPLLVERLIDLLHERGYPNVVVGAAPGGEGRWLENRDVVVVADLVGYRFATDAGHPYDVVDLAEDVVPVPFPGGSTLHGTGLSRAWAEAHFRVNFVKNKTHEEYFYALCLHNLLGVLPLRDKQYHYRARLKPWDVCVDLLRQAPPHFNVIDAVVSNHGSAGSRISRPLETGSIIAAEGTLLADWAGAMKMGLDPYASPLNAKSLADVGLPDGYEISGDLTPYEGWENVHPLLAYAGRQLHESVELSRALQAVTLPVNRKLFPFKDERLDRLNAMLAPALANVERNAAIFPATAILYLGLAAAARGVEAWCTLFAKRQLRRKEVPLDLDLASFALPDYERVVDYIRPLEELIRSTPADASGLKWRYLDGSVLFEFSRALEAPFDEFARRVDISRSIQFMKDYIGGRWVPVARDGEGRVTHQAERNVYLPQPNYLVLYGGDVIDVSKLEYIRYGEREQKIFWRTIKSSNDSAEFDDGSVTFSVVDDRHTRVTVLARQKFALPLFWQAVNLDLAPEVKDFLVTDAYSSFFDQTLDNFEAKYHGREVRVGRPWDPREGEPDAGPSDSLLADGAAIAADRLNELVRRFAPGALAGRLLGTRAAAGTLDADGFRHFPPPASAGSNDLREGRHATRAPGSFASLGGEFLKDLGNAVRYDLGLDARDE